MTDKTQARLVGPVVALSELEARRLTRRITDALSVAWELVAEAYARRVWEPLGYGSWDAYCRAEFAATRLRLPAEEREETVRSLRAAGLSQRAIASATGTAQDTVRRDLAAGERNRSPEAVPRPVTGLDGKQYPHPPSAAPSVAAGEADDPVDAEIVDENPRPGPGDRGPGARSGPRRRPLPEQARDAGWDLRKAIERIERLAADDRSPRLAGQLRTALRGHLIYATETAGRLLEQFNDDPNEGALP